MRVCPASPAWRIRQDWQDCQGRAGLEVDGCQGPLFWLPGWTKYRASLPTHFLFPIEGSEENQDLTWPGTLVKRVPAWWESQGDSRMSVEIFGKPGGGAPGLAQTDVAHGSLAAGSHPPPSGVHSGAYPATHR